MFIKKKVIIHLGALGDLVHTCKAIEGTKDVENYILITDEDYYETLNQLFNITILSVSRNFLNPFNNNLKIIYHIFLAKSVLVMHKKKFIFQILKFFKSSENFFYSKKTDHKLQNRYDALKISFGYIKSDFKYIYFKQNALNKSLQHKIGNDYILIATNGGNKYAKYSARTVNPSFLSETLKYSKSVIVLVGEGKIDDFYYKQLKKILKNKKIINLSSKLNVLQLLSLIQNSKLNIMNDSFPMQIAQYTSSRVLGLFGPTNPNEVLLPNSKISTLVTKSICKFCYNHNYSKFSLMYNCTNNICSEFNKIYLNEYI